MRAPPWSVLRCGSAVFCASLVAATPAARAGEATAHGWVADFTDFRGDLLSPDPAARLRAVERLGSSVTAQSRVALVHAVRDLADLAAPRAPTPEHSAPVELAPEDRSRLRLALARALAEHATHPEARQALVRLMNSATDGAEPHDDIALQTAALALARTGAPDATEALGRALWQSPALARAAQQALVAYPPTHLEPLLEAARGADALLELLGELGDQRAHDFLRSTVREASPPRAALAAWALFRLGEPETQELARHWWRQSSHPAHRFTATRILVEAEDPLAVEAMAALLTDLPPSAPERHVVLDLAAQRPRPEWEAALLRLARPYLSSAATTETSTSVLLALAKLDGPIGARHLVTALSGPHAVTIAEALAQTDGAQVDRRLGQALSDPARRAWALRILAVRLARGTAEARRERVEQTARQLLSSGAAPGPADAAPRPGGIEPRDAAAAAWALAVAFPKSSAELLESPELVVMQAAARQAFRPPLASRALALLAREARAPTAAAEARGEVRRAWLLHALGDTAAEGVPTRRLRSLLAEAHAPAPPLIEAFAVRVQRRAGLLADQPTDMRLADVRRWLGAHDTPSRAAAARGLGRADAPAAVALLGQALLGDAEAVVRRTAAHALSQRPEPARRRALSVAADLDPDPLVRSVARRGLHHPPAPHAADQDATDPPEQRLLWLQVEQVDQPVELVTAFGRTLLLAPDPDGFVGVFGAPPEPWEVRRPPVAKQGAEREARP